MTSCTKKHQCIVLIFFIAFLFHGGLKAAEKDNTIVQAQEVALFTENKGQIIDSQGNRADDVLFSSTYQGFQLYFSKKGISYVWTGTDVTEEPLSRAESSQYQTIESSYQLTQKHPKKRKNIAYRMDMELLGASPATEVIPEEAATYYSHYYLAHCPQGITPVGHYGKITYKNIYPNIDWVIYGTGGGVKYDFVVHPGGRVEDIRINYIGDKHIKIRADGSIQVSTSMGYVVEGKPYTYEKGTGETIASTYYLKNDQLLFDIGDYDKQHVLVIDPEITWSTYLGGNKRDKAEDVATDHEGNVYVTGETQSSVFPAAPGLNQHESEGLFDAFVTKFNPKGEVLWHLFFGGGDQDQGKSIAVDHSGNLAILGHTASEAPSKIPLQASSFQKDYTGDWDVFIAKIDAEGGLLWSTYYGGSQLDIPSAITFDKTGALVAVGYSESKDLSGENKIDNSNQSDDTDGFIIKFDNAGDLLWGAYLGSGVNDFINDVVVNSEGSILLAGTITGLAENDELFPLLSFDLYNGGDDMFLAHYSSDGNLLWTSFYGKAGDEKGNAITLSKEEHIIIGGNNANNVPMVAQFRKINDSDYILFWEIDNITVDVKELHDIKTNQVGDIIAAGYDTNDKGFLAKLSSKGDEVQVVWVKEQIGGANSVETLHALALDCLGDIYVVGETGSNQFYTKNAAQETFEGVQDAVVVKLRETSVWDGSEDNNWANPLNWDDDRVPTRYKHVIIPSGLLNYPVISSPLAVCRDIVVEADASLTIDINNKLEIYGSLLNKGETEWGKGGILFKSDPDRCYAPFEQLIDGNLKINTLEIADNHHVIINSGQTSCDLLKVDQACKLAIEQDATLSLYGNLAIEGVLDPLGGSMVSFEGDNDASVHNDQHFSYLRIQKNNSHSTVTLHNHITVDDTLWMLGGDIDLSDYNISLGNTGALAMETEENRIFGNTGTIQAQNYLNQPQSENLGGLGAIITSSKDLGEVVIIRGHEQQITKGGDGFGILRYYDIQPSNDTDLDATLEFSYFEGELAGINEAELDLWRYVDGLGQWYEQGALLNTDQNNLIKTGIPAFSKWTAGSTTYHPLPLVLHAFSATCQEGTVLLEIKADIDDGEHIVIEKSSDGVNWSFLNEIKDIEQFSWSIRDRDVTNDFSYYRLVLAGSSGDLVHYKTIAISCSSLNKPVITIFPNPADKSITINALHINQGLLNLSVINALGEVVFVKTYIRNQMDGIFRDYLDISNLRPGVYTLQFVFGEKVFYKKVLVR